MREILIADDHPLFRDALRRSILTAWPQALIREASDVASMQALVDDAADAELLLLDLHMPGASGFSALVHVRAQHPGLPIIVISAHEERSVVARAIAHGASGYIPKSAPVKAIVEAIHHVLAGGVWLPTDAAPTPLQPAEADAASRIAELTPQQFRVLAMIGEGLLNKQIAYELQVGETTVKAHVSEILRKLNVYSRTQAVIEVSKLDNADLFRDPAGF